MTELTHSARVVVIGAGPVGLFTALALARQGLHVTVFERQHARCRESRAIGIHPPALEIAEILGVGRRMRERGVAVRQGHAQTGDEILGTVDFRRLSGPHPYVLSLPQAETESILEDAISQQDGIRLERGTSCLKLACRSGVSSVYTSCDGKLKTTTADFVIAADGHASQVRETLGISVRRRHYTDAFVMGDFPDDSDWQADARIFFDDDGWLESFPMPGRLRRWVASVPGGHARPDRIALCELVARRSSQTLDAGACLRISAFGIVQQYARQLVKGSAALVGDAAHVVSPIGGQGMNLGWLGAWDLADVLGRLARGTSPAEISLAHWERRRLRAARMAMRRADFNMAIGRHRCAPRLRNFVVRRMLEWPFHDTLARSFTMQGR